MYQFPFHVPKRRDPYDYEQEQPNPKILDGDWQNEGQLNTSQRKSLDRMETIEISRFLQ